MSGRCSCYGPGSMPTASATASLAVVDSLRRIVAHQDSLLAIAATTADTFKIVAPTPTLWDRPILHALLGALVGGGISIFASIWAVNRARDLQDHRSLAALVSRLVFMLEGT